MFGDKGKTTVKVLFESRASDCVRYQEVVGVISEIDVIKVFDKDVNCK